MATQPRCSELTKAGGPCKMFALKDDPDGICNIHRAVREGRALGTLPPVARRVRNGRTEVIPKRPDDGLVLHLSPKRGPGRPAKGSRGADPLALSDRLASQLSATPHSPSRHPSQQSPGSQDPHQETVLDRLQALVPVALERLEALIRNDDGTVKPETQMRAAEAILDRFAAKKISHESKTVPGQRKLDEELAPIIQRLRATGTDASDGDPG